MGYGIREGIKNGFPDKQGLYDPAFEKDSCGVGFVCDIKGRKSHDIVLKGLEVLKRLSHRGATGADPKTGDGAGILIQMPHDFFSRVAGKLKINLPPEGQYASGLIFLPKDKKDRTSCKDVFLKTIKANRQVLLGWRSVPLDDSDIGKSARAKEPVIEQIFIKKNESVEERSEFERKLYVIRRQAERKIGLSSIKQKSFFYVNSLSSRTFIYKGLLMPYQMGEFFPDLKDEDMKSAISLVHSRYSTNTFPTWDLAQPFRFMAHNGEINTLRGNLNWMKARESLLASKLFGKDIEKIKPILKPGLSDSATIDSAFELLVLGGRPIYHAMMMLIPGAWEHNSLMDPSLRDFYKYHACFMEPWDGPAAIAFTDGTNIGAVLDRNGLRPARYIVTKDQKIIMASEAGVLDIDPSGISVSGRLEPGKIFYVDTQAGKIVSDKEIKKKTSDTKPYGKWLKDNMVELDRLPELPRKPRREKEDTITRMKAFGYTREDLKVIIKPMAEEGKEPTGSMGNDSPLAILSKKSQLFYNYFKQLFAQVTNPAIDPIREECVMSLESFIGPQRNILSESPEHCHKLRVKEPILTDDDLEKIRNIKQKGFRTKTISILFNTEDKKDFRGTLERICEEALEAIKKKYSFIILSDRGISDKYAALPAVLAVGAVHQRLIKESMRTHIGIILESAEPREVFHFALLFGYGADCVNPYLTYESLDYLIKNKMLSLSLKKSVKNYRKAVEKGILKVLSKMGISTLRSYRGAQIFEALGVGEEVIESCFGGTVSRIGGVDFETIRKETVLRHKEAFPERNSETTLLSAGGAYKWTRGGEFHLWNPESISLLQGATRKDDYGLYKEFSRTINDQSANPTTLRGLLKFKKRKAISLDSVEPAENIYKRFATGAMSFGSISRGAHESLAIAMNRLGGKSNTGEGGEDPERFKVLPGGESKRSAIKQVASGRFGVSTNYLTNADELQIKIAQGAKPGEGGQLPGHKVSATIARIRYTTPRVTLISPPPHHDIYSIEDLAQLIFDLKNTNPRARISVKLVSETGVGTIAAGVAKGRADMILISGGDGGTGASPISSIRHAGLPWELGLSETHQTLVLNDLRSRVRLQTDGQMRTGRDVAIAAILGAEEYGFCTAALIVLGCVMLRHCHLNNCALGVATQDDILQERFHGSADHVVNYVRFVVRELREIMAQLGIRSLNELIGRTDLVEVNKEIIPWKADKIDFSGILYKPRMPRTVGIYKNKKQEHAIEKVLDADLIREAKSALKERKNIKKEFSISNVNRAAGAMLSGEVCRLHGESGLSPDTIWFKFKGVAGQSFGAWLAHGITFDLEGMANDYIGKGISGGKIIVYPDKNTDFMPGDNIIIGNTTFYGAIRGEAYIRGKAGERFCIRNSGLNAVVEGVGDHGCEYMTGGKAVILGETGRNFGAGMSGGIAFVYDRGGKFKKHCNMEMIEFDEMEEKDKEDLRRLLFRHKQYTGSDIAGKILEDFETEIAGFVKVIPTEYKKILELERVEGRIGLSETFDG